MTLEDMMAHLNRGAFWREFTFADTRFRPGGSTEVELADGLVKVADLAFVFQMKARSGETSDPAVEARWFSNKVVKKAVAQIKVSLRYLAEHDDITLTNGRGRAIKVRGAEMAELRKVVVYLPGAVLPDACRAEMYHLSSTAGFIHLIAANDYLGILDKLRVPEDIRLYFDYREKVLPRLKEAGTAVEEPDIMVGFLMERDLPAPGTRDMLAAFVQDLESFDLTHIMRHLGERIVNGDGGEDYHRILEEFARLPRSAWREIKTRLMHALDASRRGECIRPLRVGFPATDCTFLVAALDPDWPSTGEEGERTRIGALRMFTTAGKYSLRTGKAVGVLVSQDGEHVNLDWCRLDAPWEHDPTMETMLAELQLFKPITSRRFDSFFFRTDG